MNVVIKLCRWFDGFVAKLGDWALVVLPAIVIILMAFLTIFHLLAFLIGKLL